MGRTLHVNSAHRRVVLMACLTLLAAGIGCGPPGGDGFGPPIDPDAGDAAEADGSGAELRCADVALRPAARSAASVAPGEVHRVALDHAAEFVVRALINETANHVLIRPTRVSSADPEVGEVRWTERDTLVFTATGVGRAGIILEACDETWNLDIEVVEPAGWAAASRIDIVSPWGLGSTSREPFSMSMPLVGGEAVHVSDRSRVDLLLWPADAAGAPLLGEVVSLGDTAMSQLAASATFGDEAPIDLRRIEISPGRVVTIPRSTRDDTPWASIVATTPGEVTELEILVPRPDDGALERWDGELIEIVDGLTIEEAGDFWEIISCSVDDLQLVARTAAGEPIFGLAHEIDVIAATLPDDVVLPATGVLEVGWSVANPFDEVPLAVARTPDTGAAMDAFAGLALRVPVFGTHRYLVTVGEVTAELDIRAPW